MPSEYMTEYEEEATAKAYYPFPGPCDEGIEAIEKIREWLTARGVLGTGGGIIAVAHADNGHIFFAFSSVLQSEIASLKARYQNMKTAHRSIQTFCEYVDKHLFAIFKKYPNPACAEKKILSKVRRSGRTIANLTIGEYPEWETNKKLSSYVEGGSGRRALIAPCRSCLSAYTTAGFNPAKKAS